MSITSSKKHSVPALDIKDVDYTFDAGENAKQVLFKNTLEIQPGEIVIMTGPSGSGKTTLLTLIGTLRSIQTGSIKFLGQELAGLSKTETNNIRGDIGFIFQHHNLFESLSALDTMRVTMQLKSKNISKEDVLRDATQLLDRLGLGERVNYKPSRLSGGQKQRVAIARALINKPKLILADEPTAALDQESGRIVVEMFQELARENGSTVLIVTHDNRILDAADRIVNMMDGHIHSNVLIKEHIRLCEIMSQIHIFKDTRTAVLNSLVHHLQKVEYPPETTIIRQGDVGERFYILDRGEASVSVEKEGKPTEVDVISDGAGFGEVALLRDEPRLATITTKTHCQVYWLHKDEFLRVIENAPALGQELKNMYMS